MAPSLVPLEFCVFYKSLRWSIQEYQLCHKVLFKLQFTAFSNQINVQAEFEDLVYVGEFREHDGEGYAAEHHAHKFADDKDDGDIQTDDAGIEK